MSNEFYMKGKEVDLGSPDGKFDTVYINIQDWNEIQKKLKVLEIIKKKTNLTTTNDGKKALVFVILETEEQFELLKEVLLCQQ